MYRYILRHIYVCIYISEDERVEECVFICVTHSPPMEARDGEKSRQAGAQVAEWLAASWNGPAYDALAGVCFCSGRARPCSGAASVASEMTSFTSPWRMRAHPARGAADDASARAMTAGLVFPIVYPLLPALQACADINASTTLRHNNGNQHCISSVCLHPIPNSFLSRKASLVRMRSRINYKRPILIQ